MFLTEQSLPLHLSFKYFKNTLVIWMKNWGGHSIMTRTGKEVIRAKWTRKSMDQRAEHEASIAQPNPRILTHINSEHG